MSWNYDKEPIDYLIQRVKYYQKRKSKVKKLIDEPLMIEKYGKPMLGEIVMRRMIDIDAYISMYKNAIYFLDTIANHEVILQPHWDKNGYLDGGTIVEEGRIKGHIDPRGEPGEPGFIGTINKE